MTHLGLAAVALRQVPPWDPIPAQLQKNRQP